jgi:hypothetical protein
MKKIIVLLNLLLVGAYCLQAQKNYDELANRITGPVIQIYANSVQTAPNDVLPTVYIMQIKGQSMPSGYFVNAQQCESCRNRMIADFRNGLQNAMRTMQGYNENEGREVMNKLTPIINNSFTCANMRNPYYKTKEAITKENGIPKQRTNSLADNDLSPQLNSITMPTQKGVLRISENIWEKGTRSSTDIQFIHITATKQQTPTQQTSDPNESNSPSTEASNAAVNVATNQSQNVDKMTGGRPLGYFHFDNTPQEQPDDLDNNNATIRSTAGGRAVGDFIRVQNPSNPQSVVLNNNNPTIQYPTGERRVQQPVKEKTPFEQNNKKAVSPTNSEIGQSDATHTSSNTTLQRNLNNQGAAMTDLGTAFHYSTIATKQSNYEDAASNASAAFDGSKPEGYHTLPQPSINFISLKQEIAKQQLAAYEKRKKEEVAAVTVEAKQSSSKLSAPPAKKQQSVSNSNAAGDTNQPPPPDN